jgi:dihydroneopterin aldolase
MDWLTLSQLQVPVVIGVNPEEKSIIQTLLIDFTFSIDVSRCALSDDLADTIDYTAIRRDILHFANESRYELLETFTAKLADHLKSTFSLGKLTLSVTKVPMDMFDVEGVRVMVER